MAKQRKVIRAGRLVYAAVYWTRAPVGQPGSQSSQDQVQLGCAPADEHEIRMAEARALLGVDSARDLVVTLDL